MTANKTRLVISTPEHSTYLLKLSEFSISAAKYTSTEVFVFNFPQVEIKYGTIHVLRNQYWGFLYYIIHCIRLLLKQIFDYLLLSNYLKVITEVCIYV